MSLAILLCKDTATRTSLTWGSSMFAVQFGIVCTILMGCWQTSHAATGLLKVNNRTRVALANETLHFNLMVTIPPNSSRTTVFCYQNQMVKWSANLKNKNPIAKTEDLWANITMQNSSDSGEYFFQYQLQKVYWVALVQDVGYPQPDITLETGTTPLLVVTLILLLFSIMGSVYIFKWHKDHPQSEKGGDGVKARKSESNVGVTTQGTNSDSVYTTLEPRPASIYEVMNADQARRESMEKHTSDEMSKTSQEGIFESVYMNVS